MPSGRYDVERGILKGFSALDRASAEAVLAELQGLKAGEIPTDEAIATVEKVAPGLTKYVRLASLLGRPEVLISLLMIYLQLLAMHHDDVSSERMEQLMREQIQATREISDQLAELSAAGSRGEPPAYSPRTQSPTQSTPTSDAPQSRQVRRALARAAAKADRET